MTKRDFLDAIRRGLSSLSEDDINKSVRYYSEMIDDRIEDGISEEDAVAALGDPETVIAQILENTDIPHTDIPQEEIVCVDLSSEQEKKHGKKGLIFAITGIVMLVIVLLIAVGTLLPMIKVGFNKDALTTGYGYFTVDSDTSAVSKFDSVNISEDFSNVRILPSETNDCLVQFTSFENIHRYYDIGDDGTLYITMIDNRSWFEKLGGFWYEDSTVTLYLPYNKYYKLQVDTSSGDVFVSDEFEFQYVEITTSSGDIDFRADAGDLNSELNVELKSASGDIMVSNVSKGGFSIETTSGDVTLSDVYLCEIISVNTDDISKTLNDLSDSFAQSVGITIKTVSGDVKIHDVRTIDLFIETTSGDIELNDVYNYLALQVESTSGTIDADNTVSLAGASFETTSGDISFDGLDSYARIALQSTSGDIEGYIASNCFFAVKTSSGSVNVPQNNDAASISGRPLHHCSVTTVSGDINIRTPQ